MSERKYKVTVIVTERDLRMGPYEVLATRKGQATTKAIMAAFSDGLKLSGEFVEYEVE